jgi:hypothetical protein
MRCMERASGFGPLSREFEPYLIAGLMGFDMRRTMGAADPYSTTEGFGLRLSNSLQPLEADLRRLASERLATADLGSIGSVVKRAYDCIADRCAEGGKFHVGATKVLHWLFPDLFIMLDRNAAMAFQEHHMVGFRRTTQPGYSAQNYFKCLELAKEEIVAFGVERFHALEPDTPDCQDIRQDRLCGWRARRRFGIRARSSPGLDHS